MSLARTIAGLFGSGTTIAASNLPPQVPAGTLIPFSGTAAPSGWLLAYGQAVSRTTFADLYAAIGTAFGAGDGSTTFALPDMRGRVPGGKDDMGGTPASRLSVTLTGTKASTENGSITGLSGTSALSIGMKAFGTGIGVGAVITAIISGTAVTLSVNSTSTGATPIRFAVVDGATLGASGGNHVHQLGTEQIPAHTHGSFVSGGGAGGGSFGVGDNGVFSETTSVGGTQAHPILQPTLVLNYIIKT